MIDLRELIANRSLLDEMSYEEAVFVFTELDRLQNSLASRMTVDPDDRWTPMMSPKQGELTCAGCGGRVPVMSLVFPCRTCNKTPSVVYPTASAEEGASNDPKKEPSRD